MVSTRGSLRLLQREKPQLTLPLPGISSQRFGAARQCFRGFQRGRRRAASRWRDAAGAWLVEGAGLWRGGGGEGLRSTPVFTRRARSSPRHARGLNVAHFLRPCRPPSAAKAAGWRQGMG
nr:MAG TPA: hypothetical protein [Caudoviricetes sp.]DAQ46460.1 MAG TPA: hypothetical protein [Caudoviricetes sp.]